MNLYAKAFLGLIISLHTSLGYAQIDCEHFLSSRKLQQAADPELISFIPIMRAFSASGSKGRLIRLKAQDRTNVKKWNYLIHVQSLNEGSVFDDPKLEKLVQPLLTSGHTLILSSYDKNRGVVAAVVHEKLPTETNLFKELGKNAIFLTPRTDFFYLQHELVHWADLESGTATNFYNEIIASRDSGNLSKDSILEIYFYIAEHRAHSEQAVQLETAYENDSDELQKRRFKRMKKDTLSIFHVMYAEPLKDTLQKLSSTNPELYRRIIEVIQKYVPQNSQIPPIWASSDVYYLPNSTD